MRCDNRDSETIAGLPIRKRTHSLIIDYKISESRLQREVIVPEGKIKKDRKIAYLRLTIIVLKELSSFFLRNECSVGKRESRYYRY